MSSVLIMFSVTAVSTGLMHSNIAASREVYDSNVQYNKAVVFIFDPSKKPQLEPA